MMKQNRLKYIVFFLFSIALLFLAIYSYSQIDLNLTLSSNAFYQNIQQKLIYLGYFRRQLSTSIFLIILLLLFCSQIGFLLLAKRKIINSNTVWKLSLLSAILLLFSYPAFSHDIFNYIFDSRLVVVHEANPWANTALNFPDDLWTRFMRWTHRTYPYGPVWLVVTIPFYLAGLGKFSLTLFWFKLLGAISYVSSVYFIRRISEIISKKQTTTALILFAFNPLILIESLVSSHIDITMTAFFLAAFYLIYVQRKKLSSWILLLSSIGIKFITAATLPIWIWWKGRYENVEKAITYMLLLTLVAIGVVIIKREILPWYFITPLALSALIPQKREYAYIGIFFSAGLLLRYSPYLLIGDFTEWVHNVRDILTISSLLIGLFFILWIRKKNSPLFSS